MIIFDTARQTHLLLRFCTLLWVNGLNWTRTALCWMCAVGQEPSEYHWQKYDLLLRIHKNTVWVNRKPFTEQQLAALEKDKQFCVVINRGWRRWLALNCARRQWKMLRLTLKLMVSQSNIIIFCCFSSLSHDLLRLQMYIFRLVQCRIPLWKGWRFVPHCS